MRLKRADTSRVSRIAIAASVPVPVPSGTWPSIRSPRQELKAYGQPGAI